MPITQSIYYRVPKTLEREKEILENKINLLIEAFNQLCKEENERINKETEIAISTRTWEYEVKEIEDGYSILYKKATNPVEGREDNEQWSHGFKIVNDVIIIKEGAFKNKSWTIANNLLPKNGTIVPDSFQVPAW